MFEKARLLNLLVCAVFGLAGGMVSHLLLNARAASAQQTSTLVRTERLELLDGKGNLSAVFGRDPGRPELGPSLVIGSGQRKITLSDSALNIYDGGAQRIVLGLHGFPMTGGAYGLDYQLVVYDSKGKVNHRLR